VAKHWINNTDFLAGYGAAQAMPGPLFSFAAFLGEIATPANSEFSSLLCQIAIYIPSFLLMFGILPFWGRLQSNPILQTALIGVNASVVGLLLAAFYQPVWQSAILAPKDFSLAILLFVGLMFWKWPAWCLVVVSVVLGWLTSIFASQF
jgi:chromate transporter